MTLSRIEAAPLAFPLGMTMAKSKVWPAAALHDGISFSALTGRVTIKAPGAAASVLALTSAFTFTGGNQSMFVGADGLLQQSATNTPRIEYGPGGGVLGLLMEASRTNLCLQSQTLDDVTWFRTRVSVSANAIAAPDGTTTADKLVEDATAASTHFMSQSFVKGAVAQAYTVSAWFKAAERSTVRFRVMDLAGGANGVRSDIDLSAATISAQTGLGAGFTIGTSTLTAYANGWYRATMSLTSDTSLTLAIDVFLTNPAGTPTYNGDGASGCYVWGVQLEQAAFASSYIPTTTIAVTRTADSCIRTLASEFSATAGTVVVAGRASGGQDAANQHVYSLDNGSNAEIIRLYRNNAADTVVLSVTDTSVNQVLQATDNFVNSTAFKSAIAYALNDVGYSFNGGAAVVGNTATMPTPTQLVLGGTGFIAAPMNGHIRTFDYYPTRLTNAQLQQMSI
jgi:hypothetical protein